MKVVIDRFEGEIAVIELENGNMVDIPKKILPNNAKEGSIVNITCDEKESLLSRDAAKKKMHSIFHS